MYAGREYMVMVSTGDGEGYYPAVNGFFAQPGDNGDSLAWPENAGRYGGKSELMPTAAWGGSCYLRDVIFVPSEILPGVVILNNAGTDPAAVRAALESPELNLNLSIYSILSEEEKDQVIAGVIAQKPENGYLKKSSIQAVVDSIAIAIYEETVGRLVRDINEAATVDEMRAAIELPELGFNLLIYNALSYVHKDAIAQALLDNRPEGGYRRTEAIQEIIDTEAAEMLSLPSDNDIPLVYEEFHPWEGAVSPDGIWRKAGTWQGTGGNTFEVERAITQETYGEEDGGFLILKSLANSKNGAEIQTLTTYGYGYYETRMKPTDVYAVANSFFWVEAPGYGPHEWDIEFFTVKDNKIDYTIHPFKGGNNRELTPGFTISDDFHRYGFLWTPGRIDYTIDGEIVWTFTDEILNTDAKGYIMMNSWTEETWLDGPPATDAEVVYDWVKHYPLNEVNKKSLENAIKAAQALYSFEYTAESWQHMQEVLTEAIKVEASFYSNQSQIDAAASDLLASMDELEEVESNLPAESMFPDWSDVGSLKTDMWDCNYGITFSTAVPGKITHIRVFGLAGETGDHTAYIWENETGKMVGGPYTINYTGNNEWVEYRLPEAVRIPQAGKPYTVVVTTGDTGLVPILREGTAEAGNNGASIYWPANAGVFGPMGANRPTVSWRYNYLRDIVFVPYDENPAVVEVNAADSLTAMRDALEKYPQLLDLSEYDRLSDDDRNSIAQAVLDGKSGGFEKVQQIQQIIDVNAEIFVNAEIEAALALVNSSGNTEELASALASPFLELKTGLYETLSQQQKTAVLENILSARPVEGFANPGAIKEIFDTEVKDLLYSRIIKQDDDFFPIGVWMQNPAPSVMEQYKEIGINTYISLSSGAFNETLYNMLKEYGMKAIVGQNTYARENMSKAEEVILGWLQEDEPDIVRFTPDWWPLTPLVPEEIFDRYVELKKYNQTIPVYLNLSQGVANPNWPGRGVDSGYTYMYPEYAKAADILSFDVYCVNDGYDLSTIARGVDNLYGYSDGKQPVWAFIETTKFNEGNSGRPSPEQVKSQVWMAIVHGAKGISYFCHQFTPDFVEAGPLDPRYADIKEAIRDINAQITSLAPVLNSPSISGYASVASSNADVTIDLMAKKYNGAWYIFAVNMNNASTNATFSISKGFNVEVLGENRHVGVSAGKFTDGFVPYGVHIYKISDATDNTPEEPSDPQPTPQPTSQPTPQPSGTGTSGTPANKAEISGIGTSGITLPVSVNTDTGNAATDLSDLAEDILSGEKTVVITIPSILGVNSYTLAMPADSLNGSQGKGSLTFSTGLGSVTIPFDMLAGMPEIEGKNAAITIGRGDSSELPAEVQAAIGDRPVVQLTLTLDGEKMEWNNPDTSVAVTIPYTPTAEELADPEHIVVWYIDGSGNVVSVPNGRYNPETGTVTFRATHFSYYAVAYVHKTFSDLDGHEWARKAVEVMASRGIINGTGENSFSPAADITRADYLVLLVRTLGLTAKFEGNFDDVESGTYYYEAVGIARKLGIALGSGDNNFNPKAKISRQDMMVLTARALEKFKGLTAVESSAVLDEFNDKGDIAGYAVSSLATLVKEGLIAGSGDRLNPRANATRAEAAMFLYRIYNKF